MDKDTKKNIIAITIIIVLFLAIIMVALMLVKGVDNFSFSLGNGREKGTRKPSEVTQEATLEPTKEATQEATKEPEEEPTDDPFEGKYTFTELDKEMYAQSGVNVRLEPHKDGEKIGHLSTNDKVKVTGQCNETSWYRIVFDDKTAYVSNNYLGDNEHVATPEPTQEPTPEPTQEATPEPTKEPTPEPTKEATPEPTPEPTKDAAPEPTPEPTKEPEVLDEGQSQDETDNDNADDSAR